MGVKGKQAVISFPKGWSSLVVFLVLLSLAGPSREWGRAEPFETGYSLRQGDFSQGVIPLAKARSAPAFYNYSDYQANNRLVIPNHSLLFLYRDTDSGELSLFIIHDAPDDGTDGSVSFSFSGLPPGARFVLMDDADDTDRFSLDPPNGEAHWYWSSDHTDGLVISGIGEDFEITIAPSFLWGIDGWALLTGDADSPTIIPFPSLTEPVTIIGRNSPPRPSFVFSPSDPCIDETITFDASRSEDPDGEIVSYEWDFDGDGVFEKRLDSPIVEHSFDHASDNAVTLRVRDNLGAVGLATRQIEVKEGMVSVTRTIATSLSDHETLIGGNFRVTVTIQVHGRIMGLGLDEDVPEGWEVRPISNDGAQLKSSLLQWAFVDTIYDGERKRITYEVRVPENEQPGTFKIAGTVLAILPNLEIPVRGDSEVKVIRFLPIRIAISRLDVSTEEIDVTLPNIISFPQVQLAIALWLEDRLVPGTNGKRIDLRTMLELVTYWLTDTPVDQPLRG